MPGSIGVLVAQLGTPDAPTAPALRRYLREFLGDPRVLEMNPVGRWLLLNCIVLPLRPRRSAALYKKVWKPEGSPLLLISQAQANGLQQGLGDGVRVALGMRYGKPTMDEALEELLSAGVDRVLLFPMYPQYSAPTSASTYDQLFRLLANRRVVPTLRVVPPHYDHPAYIGALAQRVREHLATLKFEPEKLLFTFHGLPRRFIDGGDPYRAQCERTGALLGEALGLSNERFLVTFQSRFGREEWLEPYTDITLRALGRQGVTRLVVACPGFVADCLETLDEIEVLGKEQFHEGGGKEYSMVPCLNDHPAWIAALERIAREELAGWVHSAGIHSAGIHSAGIHSTAVQSAATQKERA